MRTRHLHRTDSCARVSGLIQQGPVFLSAHLLTHIAADMRTSGMKILLWDTMNPSPEDTFQGDCLPSFPPPLFSLPLLALPTASLNAACSLRSIFRVVLLAATASPSLPQAALASLLPPPRNIPKEVGLAASPFQELQFWRWQI